jgi:hypothetical protein
MDARTRPCRSRLGEAAEVLNVSESTVRRCSADGDSVERLARRRRYADVVRNAKAPARFRWPRRNRRGRSSTDERI